MPGQLLAQKVNSHHPSELQPEFILFFLTISRMTQQGKFEYYLPETPPPPIGIQSIFSLFWFKKIPHPNISDLKNSSCFWLNFGNRRENAQGQVERDAPLGKKK